jgi:hypothetical protein
LAFFAAFFSFGDSAGFFLASLLLRRSLLIFLLLPAIRKRLARQRDYFTKWGQTDFLLILQK